MSGTKREMTTPAAHRSPEMELLVACARFPPPPDAADRLSALASRPLDWDLLFKQANRHGLLPLLCDRLDRHCSEVVPPARMASLRSHFRGHALRNRVLRETLLSLMA